MHCRNSGIVDKIAAAFGLTFVSEPGAIATGFRDANAEKNPVAYARGSYKTAAPATFSPKFGLEKKQIADRKRSASNHG
jgi:hypothetical protein